MLFRPFFALILAISMASSVAVQPAACFEYDGVQTRILNDDGTQTDWVSFNRLNNFAFWFEGEQQFVLKNTKTNDEIITYYVPEKRMQVHEKKFTGKFLDFLWDEFDTTMGEELDLTQPVAFVDETSFDQSEYINDPQAAPSDDPQLAASSDKIVWQNSVAAGGFGYKWSEEGQNYTYLQIAKTKGKKKDHSTYRIPYSKLTSDEIANCEKYIEAVNSAKGLFLEAAGKVGITVLTLVIDALLVYCVTPAGYAFLTSKYVTKAALDVIVTIIKAVLPATVASTVLSAGFNVKDYSALVDIHIEEQNLYADLVVYAKQHGKKIV